MQNGVYLKEEVGKTDWAKVEGKKIAGDRGNEHPLNRGLRTLRRKVGRP